MHRYLNTLPPLLRRARAEPLCTALLGGLVLLLLNRPSALPDLHRFIDWHTLAALAGLMILSQSLNETGYLTVAGQWVLQKTRSERRLAAALVLLSGGLSMVVTNDVALFITIPLTLRLHASTSLPIGRLVIFQAFAVNAASTISPVGNPQNLFLWQQSGVDFWTFAAAMLPLGGGMLLLLLAVVLPSFSSRPIVVNPSPTAPDRNPGRLYLTILLYALFLIATNAGLALPAAGTVVLVFLLWAPRLIKQLDWTLLLIFALMFVDFGLLAELPWMSGLARDFSAALGGPIGATATLSQAISNVPATLLLAQFEPAWTGLAWGAAVGGFGLAIGSLANLIALRLSRPAEPKLWMHFHAWSIPAFALSWGMAWSLQMLFQ